MTDKVVNVNGKKMNHLRFADDIVIISEKVDALEEMVSDLNNESKKVGLKIKQRTCQHLYRQLRQVILEVKHWSKYLNTHTLYRTGNRASIMK